MNKLFRHIYLLIGFVFFANILFANTDNDIKLSQNDVTIDMTNIIVKDINVNIQLIFNNVEFKKIYEGENIVIKVNNKNVTAKIINGTARIQHTFKTKEDLDISVLGYSFTKHIDPIPLWFSVIPPLIAIIIALLFKEVFTALFLGILVGTTTIYFYQDTSLFLSIFKGLFAIIDTYILDSLTVKGHMSIILFSMLIGAMVNIITRNGGMKGVVDILSRYAKSPSSGQFITWLLGVAIFFDDYANTLVVGNTMRPVTDKLKISREKLAYIVDSTAAPVAAIAFVTTWIGAELSYIQDGINTIGINENAYSVFLNSIAYSFYPIFALLFILIIIYQKVDFGSMYIAEKKARNSQLDIDNNDSSFSNKINDLEIPENITPKWYNAAIPVGVVIIGTFVGLLYTGWDSEVWHNTAIAFSKKMSIIIGNSDSYKSLLWSSLLSVLIAIFLTVSQKILNLKKTIDSLINGFRTMLTAIVILVLAWSIALVTQHLHTADFISQILVNINISPELVPALTFVMAGLVSFSTGSSWGTMAILYPLILPASWLITEKFGLDYNHSISIFYNVVSTVLAGSVLGDHCSPISDTTILSSLASSCNHISHVRTQLPYAITVGVISVFVGTIPASYGISPLILFPIGILVMYLVVKLFGKKYT